MCSQPTGALSYSDGEVMLCSQLTGALSYSEVTMCSQLTGALSYSEDAAVTSTAARDYITVETTQQMMEAG